MRTITLPGPSARETCDRAFATARSSGSWPGQTSDSIPYRLLSRGAYPDDPESLIGGVRAGDTHSIDHAIAWLGFDPFCLWSGYLKRTLMRSLAQQKLSTRQAHAIQEVLLEILPRGRRQEFRDACRLARAVNGAPFREQLRTVIASGDPDTQQRAQWMLDGCERAATT